ncbi:MAG: AAA family ATPase [Myxococcota bacterium]
MQWIHLKNYRCFADTGKIQLRPLTLLIGANSSGKSSFLRFFPALAQTLRSETYGAFSFTNDWVDLGSFEHTVFRGAKPKEISIELGMELREAVRQYGLEREPQADPPPRLKPELGAYRVVLHQDASGIPKLKQQTFLGASSEEPLFEVYFSQDGAHFGRHHQELEELHPKLLTIIGSRFQPERFLPYSLGALRPIVTGNNNVNQFDVVFGRITRITQQLDLTIRTIAYLGPVREGPQRYYRLKQQRTDQIDMNGANLALFLHALSKSERHAFSAYCLKHIGYGVDITSHELNLSIQLFEKDSPRQKTNLIDLGYGFSQLLPVLAQLWLLTHRYAKKRLDSEMSFVCIEQPELHVHPRLQARLADLLKGVLETRRQVFGQDPTLLIETHSEPLLNRVGELIELGELQPSDVTVLLFERQPDSAGCTVRQTEFNAQGVLQDWPIGFLAG